MSLYDRTEGRRERLPFIIACALFCCILAAGAAAEGDEKERALKLYEEGRYEQALPLLEALDAAGEADGATLYRLSYCQRQLNRPEARRTQERARIQLEKDAGDSTNLEAPFYLANVYRNIGRLTDMRRVATEATARVESGELPEPTTGVEMFRLGKLYADLGKEELAADWYARSIELLADSGARSTPPYVAWAARYLADRALARGDGEAAARYRAFIPLEGMEAPTDLDSLAAASCLAGDYARAAEAWLKASQIDAANADRYRYGRNLASAAETLGGLPESAPGGRPWSELSKEELQNVMSEQVQTAHRTVSFAKRVDSLMLRLSQVASEKLGETSLTMRMDEQLDMLYLKMLESQQAAMDEARALFVAAGLQFTIKKLGIRETAFFGGFAPLIFNDDQWSIERLLANKQPDAEAHAEAATPAFGELSHELVSALRDGLNEGPAVAKLEKMLTKLEKKIGG